jgi:beta-mannosidase
MTRKEKKTFANDLTVVDYTIETVIEIWGTNSTLEEKKATLDVKCFDLETDWTHEWREDITLGANQATELWKGELPGQPKRTKESEVPKVIIISARILNENEEVLARYSNWCVGSIMRSFDAY